jgi:hypothetical protein
MPSDKPGHPKCAKCIKAQAQAHTGPPNWAADENVQDSIVDDCCGRSEHHGGNNQHNR